MKKIIFTTILLIAAICAVLAVNFSSAPMKSTITLTAHTDAPQKFVAHRGFSAVYPENSIPSIAGAAEKGYYGVEFDIHTTKDGVWILNHDSTVDKMTDGSGEIADKTIDEISSLKVDSGNGIDSYKDLKLATLEEALICVAENKIVPVIEIKGYTKESIKTLVEILDEFGLEDKAILISFDMEALRCIREYTDEIRLMFVTKNLTIEDVDTCIELGNIGIDICGALLYKMEKAVRYADKMGLEIGAWTIDWPILCDILKLYNVSLITSNRLYP